MTHAEDNSSVSIANIGELSIEEIVSPALYKDYQAPYIKKVENSHIAKNRSNNIKYPDIVPVREDVYRVFDPMRETSSDWSDLESAEYEIEYISDTNISQVSSIHSFMEGTDYIFPLNEEHHLWMSKKPSCYLSEEEFSPRRSDECNRGLFGYVAVNVRRSTHRKKYFSSYAWIPRPYQKVNNEESPGL